MTGFVRGRRLGAAHVAAFALLLPLQSAPLWAQSTGTGGTAGAGAGSAASGVGTGTGGTIAPGSPATSPPQRGFGRVQVPSPGNAEPTSPINRETGPLGSSSSGTGPGGASRTTTGTGQSTPPGVVPPLPGSSETGNSTAAGTMPDPGRTPGAPIQPETIGPSELSSGGTARTDSASTTSRPGGAQSLDECMSFWEPATHMTKDEWRTTCKRLGGRTSVR